MAISTSHITRLTLPGTARPPCSVPQSGPIPFPPPRPVSTGHSPPPDCPPSRPAELPTLSGTASWPAILRVGPLLSLLGGGGWARGGDGGGLARSALAARRRRGRPTCHHRRSGRTDNDRTERNRAALTYYTALSEPASLPAAAAPWRIGQPAEPPSLEEIDR